MWWLLCVALTLSPRTLSEKPQHWRGLDLCVSVFVECLNVSEMYVHIYARSAYLLTPLLQTSLAFSRLWHHVDARERVLGGLARSIAVTLMGKHKPVYDQSRDVGDYVVVTNAEHITVTGQKAEKKLYRHHTMYPGGLKEIPFKTMMQTKPEQILRRAVSGMLPKNKLRERRLERLKIFPNDVHPYEANIVKRYRA